MGDPVRVTREQLYDMVWSKPMNKLAAELSVTTRARQVVLGSPSE